MANLNDKTNSTPNGRIVCSRLTTNGVGQAKHSFLKSFEEYQHKYRQSIESPGKFWLEVARDFFWTQPLTSDIDQVFKYNFDINSGPISVEFLKNQKTNITYNLLDRNLFSGHGKYVAYYWEGNENNESKSIDYETLFNKVCQMANALKRLNVGIGDRVTIYLPVTIELVISMLACARIGAVHNVVVSQILMIILKLRIQLDISLPALAPPHWQNE